MRLAEGVSSRSNRRTPKILPEKTSSVLDFERIIIAQAEAFAIKGKQTVALQTLRQLGLDQWGELLWSMPDRNFPGLSSLSYRQCLQSQCKMRGQDVLVKLF